MTLERPPAAPLRRPLQPPSLRGLVPAEASRPAGELLKELPWAGPAPDPDRLTANEFLALL